MRAFYYVVLGILWLSGAALCIGAVECPEGFESFIAAANGWVESRTGFASHMTLERIAGGVIASASVLFSVLCFSRKKPSPSASPAARDANFAKVLAKLERELHQAETEAADRALSAARLQSIHEKLDAFQGRCGERRTEDAGHKCSHESCIHGECLNHEPDWEDVGEKWDEPEPRIFGMWKNYRRFRHCGRAMARYRVVQTQRCKKCGRKQNAAVITSYGEYENHKTKIAVCLCCGHRRDVTLKTRSDFFVCCLD